jgi:dihydrofolate reductase
MAQASNDANIWLVGGGELVASFADQGLLDEIIMGVTPVFLGGGAPLLPRRLLSSRVRLTSVVQDGQIVELSYELRHERARS